MVKKVVFGCAVLLINVVAAVDYAHIRACIEHGSLTAAWLCRYDVGREQLNACVTDDMHTPLGIAIKAHAAQAVRVLLQAGADVQVPTGGMLPLEFAAQHSTVEIFKQLLLAGARMTPAIYRYAPQKNDLFYFLIHLFTPLYVGDDCAGNNDYHLTRAQVHAAANELLLHVVDEHELMDTLKLGADVAYRDEQGWSAIDYALAACRWRVVAVLRAQGALPVLQAAVLKAQERAASAANCFKADDCTRALREAYGAYELAGVYDQFVECVKTDTLTEAFLRRYFTGVNALFINRQFGKQGNCDALTLAVQAGHVRAAHLLMRYGAHVHRDVLQYALEQSPKKMVRLLLEYGGRLHWVDKPLEVIIAHNPHAVELVDWLAPATMRVQRNQALCFAQKQSKPELVESLERARAHC